MRGIEPGFLTIISGDAAEDVDTHMNDLDRLSLIHCFSSFRSASDIEYMQPNGGLPPLTRGIVWST